MNFRNSITAIPLLAAFLWAGPAPAQSEAGFSRAKLVSLAPAKSGEGACIHLEATFSDPLRKKPTATLDLQRSGLIDGVVSFLLDVVSLGNGRYSLTMGRSDPKQCEELRRSGEKISVTLDGAVGPDGRSLLPEEKTFNSRRFFGR